METGNGLERWRGGTDARLDDLEDSVSKLWARFEAHETDATGKYAKIVERLSTIEVKLLFFVAVAAALGAMIPQVLAAVLKHL